MATTVSYSASLRARETSSSSNARSDAACQEFYTSGNNMVGIVHFSGMSLTNKVITGISMTVTADKAGYGTSHTKTVYVRKSNYQAASQSGITGQAYTGDALGTFTGTFYGNTTSYTFTGSLLQNLAAYFSQGNNTITLCNPSPTATSHGYSYNYLQWSNCTITVTYEEASSVPSLSATTIPMGTAVTVYTNRQSTAATHTLRYSFFTKTGTIATNVGASTTWTPQLVLAAEIPNALSGWGTLYCDTYVNGTFISTKRCTFTLTVPDSVVPSITNVSYSESVVGIAEQFGCYVRTKSKLDVSVSAAGSQGSSITSYRTTIDGTAYTSSMFTTNTLNTAGDNILTVTVTDSRGRTATETRTISVADYSSPSLTGLSAQRCNADGTASQMDGTKVRVSLTGSVSSVNTRNTVSCKIYYKLNSAAAWTETATVTASNYSVVATNQLLSPTFDVLSSYDIMVRLTDYFGSVEQTVSIGTKQVLMDFYRDGNGIAFGKVAENAEQVEFGWPLILSSALGIAYGGTGATTAAQACANLGAVKKAGDTMTGNLTISGYLYPSLYLKSTYNSNTNRTVFEGSYTGASSFASWEDSSGNNRRMLEVRTKAHTNALDNAVLLRTCENDTWGMHRLFHSGMETPVPIANGGTGASDAATARSNLGANNASDLTSGTVSAARLPFKIAYGSTSISGSSSITIYYSSAGFTSVPKVIVTYSTTSSNWSGDNGAIKVHSKITTQASIVVGGNFSTVRNVDWIAIGT